MKSLKLYLLILVLISNFLTAQSESSEEWKYFGQKPPGLTAEFFAPDIISGKGRMHCFPSFTSDLQEVYWMTLPPKVFVSQFKNNKWSEPFTPEIFKNIFCLRPFVSYDNKRIYFASNLQGGKGSLDLYYIEKTETGFSEPKNLGAPINSSNYEAQQSVTENGSVYFTGTVIGKRWNRGIMYSEFKNGKYLKPITLGENINISDSNAVDYTPFIAKDGSYLLFCSNRHNPKDESCRIYLSFKNDSGKWEKPVNLSKYIKFDSNSKDPYVSPDQKFLFFSSGRNIYWVSADVISKIKKNYKP